MLLPYFWFPRFTMCGGARFMQVNGMSERNAILPAEKTACKIYTLM